ncbi:glutamine amidotransferase [Devosia aquimaris]|uniref:glutamine amidotransferase n=1 Tax=Devosia aquimaris TaxID=2866214 RepID=UPI001CD0C354|nr:glutamine amidotransferase [Devosia sp. CJK-A8-3]
MKTVTALRHVHFEDLGTLAPVLERRGYAVQYRTVGDADFLDFDPLAPDLLVVLGGPIGVYEEGAYPFLTREKALIAARVASHRPVLGICLGAQLLATALGAKVCPSGLKEIGFAPLTLTADGHAGPLRHLDGLPVLHWHGDTYTLPEGAVHLAASTLVEQQAFALGRNLLALQFHVEADAQAGFERWLVGHASELASAGIDVTALRQDAGRFGAPLAAAAGKMLEDWLDGLDIQ